MKKIPMVLSMCLAAGCSIQGETSFHISSNVPASVYVGEEYRGETPLVVDMSGGKRHTLRLVKTGYATAEMNTKPSPAKTRLMSSLSGDDLSSAVPVAFDYESYCEVFRGADPFGMTTACLYTPGTTGYPTYLAANAVTSVVTFPTATAPYLAIEYEPQQIYVQLKKADSDAFDDKRMWMIKRYVLRNFKNKSSDFYDGLQRLTDVPAAFWELSLSIVETPDGAVKTTELELADMAEISDFVRKNYDGKKIDDAFLTRLSTMTDVEKQTLERGLKLYSSPDEAARGVVRVVQVYQSTVEKGTFYVNPHKRRTLMKLMGLESQSSHHAPKCYDRMYEKIERLSEKGRTAQDFAAATVKAAEILPLAASKDKKGKEAAEDADIRKLSELSGIPLQHFEDSAVSASEEAVASVILQDRLHDFILRNYANNVSGDGVDADFAKTIADVFKSRRVVPLSQVQKILRESESPEAAANAVVLEYRRDARFQCR